MDGMLTITKSLEGNVSVLHLAGRLDGQSDQALLNLVWMNMMRVRGYYCLT